MSADGRSPQQLTEDPAQEQFPNWAPDRRQILFVSDKSGRSELYLISRETVDLHWEEPGQLTFDGAWFGKWSPDGQLMVEKFAASFTMSPSVIFVKVPAPVL